MTTKILSRTVDAIVKYLKRGGNDTFALQYAINKGIKPMNATRLLEVARYEFNHQ